MRNCIWCNCTFYIHIHIHIHIHLNSKHSLTHLQVCTFARGIQNEMKWWRRKASKAPAGANERTTTTTTIFHSNAIYCVVSQFLLNSNLHTSSSESTTYERCARLEYFEYVVSRKSRVLSIHICSLMSNRWHLKRMSNETNKKFYFAFVYET